LLRYSSYLHLNGDYYEKGEMRLYRDETYSTRTNSFKNRTTAITTTQARRAFHKDMPSKGSDGTGGAGDSATSGSKFGEAVLSVGTGEDNSVGVGVGDDVIVEVGVGMKEPPPPPPPRA